MKTVEEIIQQKEKMQEQIERLTSYWNVLGENTELSGDATFDTSAINQLRSEVDATKAKMHKLEDDNK
jgi:prefoldin subunit 5